MNRNCNRFSRRTWLIVLAVFCIPLLRKGVDWHIKHEAWTFLTSRGFLCSQRENRRASVAQRDFENELVTHKPFPWYQRYPNRVRDYMRSGAGESLCFNGTISENMIDAISVFPATTLLSLRNSSITDSQLQRLSVLHKLQILNLDHTPLTDTGLACLDEFPELVTLNVAGTAVTDKTIPILLQLKNLETLRIDSTYITASGAKQLSALKNLKWLELHGSSSNITEETLDYLREELNDCIVNGHRSPEMID